MNPILLSSPPPTPLDASLNGPKAVSTDKIVANAESKSCLSRLPEELLVLLGRCMPKTDLSRFSRTSRRLNHIFEPLLYEAVDIASEATLTLFHKAIHEHPHRAGEITSLEVGNPPELRYIVC
jgi:hypothetical protein